MKYEPLVVERIFDAAPELVWQAITDRRMMKEWYFDLSDFRPEVGCDFEFLAGPPDREKYRHVCRVTEIVPGKKIAYSWRYDGYGGMSHVSFEIFAESGGTRLRLTHAGLETLADQHPDFAVENFREGWNEIINIALRNFLAREAVRHA